MWTLNPPASNCIVLRTHSADKPAGSCVTSLNPQGRDECERHFISKDDGLRHRCISMAPEPRCVAETIGVLCKPPRPSLSPPPPSPWVHISGPEELTPSDAASGWKTLLAEQPPEGAAEGWLHAHLFMSLGAGALGSAVLIFAALGVLGTLGAIRPRKHTRLRAFQYESDEGESGVGLNSFDDVLYYANGPTPCAGQPAVSEVGPVSDSMLLMPPIAAAEPQGDVSDLMAIVEQGAPAGRRLRPDELSVIRQDEASADGMPPSGIYSSRTARRQLA